MREPVGCGGPSVLMSFWRILGWLGRDSPPKGQRVWLFYSGPENYLDKHGERDFTSGRFLWSCAKGTAKGDLALLYRRSLTRASAKDMVSEGLISEKKAEELKGTRIGSDIPILWQVTSGNKGPLAPWAASRWVVCLARIHPPVRLLELKAEPRLKRWRDLRWNLQAQGRDALEIPPFAWAVIKELISTRLDRQVPQLTD